MAAGGEVGDTKYHSSETVHEYTCGECNKGGRIIEATHYCPECDQFYCKACLCDHVVFGRSAIQKWGTGKGSTSTDFGNDEMCPKHDNVKVELYCQDHDVVFCTFCLSTSHRTCTNIVKLSDMEIETPMYSKQRDSLQRDMEDLANEFKVVHRERNVLQNVLRRDYNQYITTVKDFQSRVNEALDRIIGVAEKLKQDFDRNFEADKMLYKNKEAKFAKLQEYVTQTDEQVLSFTLLKKGKELVNNLKELLKTMEEHDTKISIKSIAENDIQQTISKIEELGKVQVDYPFITATQEGDNEVCEIVGICQLANGNMILADASNKKLKLLDDTYTIVSSYEVEATPVAVCTLGETKIAVAMNNKTVMLVNVDNTFKVSETIQLAFGCSDIAALNDELYIVPCCLEHGPHSVNIHIYGNTGNPIRKFSLTGLDYHSNGSPVHLALIGDTGERYVAIGSRLYMYDSKGEKLATQSFGYITSMCKDDSGTMYISDNDKVLTVKRQDNNLSKTSEIKFKAPRALFLDKRIGRLIVSVKGKHYLYFV